MTYSEKPDPYVDDHGPMVDVTHWSVFRRGQEGGNPCPVVIEGRRFTPGQMQAMARHYGHESAFVTGLKPGRVDLRFFVPRHEMRMCVHATIAAITALAGSGAIKGGEAVVSTASGEHRVSWTGEEPPEVTVEQAAPQFGPSAAVGAEISAVLGLPEASIAGSMPIRPVSVARKADRALARCRRGAPGHSGLPGPVGAVPQAREYRRVPIRASSGWRPASHGGPAISRRRRLPGRPGHRCGRRGPGRLPGG
jgi:hypothetical protein